MVAKASPVNSLAEALASLDVDAIARTLAAGPADLFDQPHFRHRINVHPHNRGTAHALALESLFYTDESGSAAAICRLMLKRRAPVTLAHDLDQVPAINTYATLLFVQQQWPESRVAELDALFDDYVTAGYISVNERLPVNHPVFGYQLPIEAALSQDNFPAVRALFRARCSSDWLGKYQSGTPMTMEAYIRSSAGSEERVAQALNAMMQGRIQADSVGSTSITDSTTSVSRGAIRARRMSV